MYVLNFFEKKSLHVLNWPCAYKKMSVLELNKKIETMQWNEGKV